MAVGTCWALGRIGLPELSASETQCRNLRALQGLVALGVGFLLEAAVTIWTLTHPA